MPFKLDSQTGQYDFEPYGDSGEQQPEVLIAAAPPKKKEDKPWWEQVGDSIMKGPGIGRYVQVDERGLSINTDNISNDLQYEAKRLTKSPQSAGSRLLDYATSSPQMQLLLPGGTDLNTEARAANAQALGNAQKALYPFVAGGSKLKEPAALGENPTEEETATYNEQRDAYDAQERQKQVDTLDYEAAVDEQVEAVYVSSEKKPRSEMTDAELAGDDFKASLALNIGLVAGQTLIPPLGLARLGAAYPRLAPLINAANFTNATTKRGFIAKLFVANALDEGPSTYLDDNTGGSAVQLPAFIFNYFGATELAESIAAMDPVKPGMSRTEASNAALGPNLTASTTFAGIIGGGTAALSRVLNLGLPNTRRARQAQSQRTTREAVREQLEADGITQTDDTGKTAFTEEAVKPKDASWAEAERELVEEVGLREPEPPREIPTDEMAPGGAVDARGQMPEPVDADIDPWTAEYDPSSTVEADALLETVQGNLDADDIAEVIARGETENIPAVVDELAQRAQPEQIDAEMATDNVVAPTESLSGTGTTADRFASVSVARLWSLAMNTPEIAQEIVLKTGKDQNQWTRMDIIAGLSVLEGRGLSVMPNRMMGFPMMRTVDISLDVARFQYKQSVTKSGVQKGNSLDGVELWSQDSEGLIQVWEDPDDGLIYVVNGHNRLALAIRLGIPTLRVELINAPNWKQARMKGAITNIADGRGTAFDAGKYFRDAGITDLSQVGKEVPLKSGLANDGLALSRLPDNIFRAAQDGVITLKKAVALGNSGLDETAMQAAYKILSKRNMNDDVFGEVLQQGRSSTTVEGSQVDIFGNTEMLNTMETKAELVADIRRQLGTAKRAARSAANNASTLETAGNSIDRAGSQTLADDTEALIRQFDADKYMDTPLSQKLNEGAEQILQGAKRSVVVNRIKREVVEAAQTSPLTDKTPTPEPVPAAPTRRDQERTLLTMAARKGEARPPESPLVETPDPGDVQLDGKPEPLAALDVMDNEARVRDDYKVIDDAIKGDELEAKRAEIGYDMMAFEQKKQNGLLDGLEEPAVSTVKIDPNANPERWAAQFGNKYGPGKGLLGISEARWLKVFKERGVPDLYELAGGQSQWERFSQGYEMPEIEAKLREFASADGPRADLEAAGRPITEKNRNRVDGQADSLWTWVNSGRPDAQAVLPSREAAISAVETKGKLFNVDQVPGIDLGEALNDQAMGRTTPATEAVRDAYMQFYGLKDKPRKLSQQAASKQAFKLPADVAKSKPRFGMAQLQFASDLDRAAYIIRNKAKASKGEARIIKALEDQGYDIPEIRARGDEVKNLIQDVIEEQTGSRRAPQEALTLEIPDTDAPGIRASRAPGEQTRGYSEKQMRQRLQAEQEIMQSRKASALLDLGTRIPRDVAERAMMSEVIAKDMVAGLKEAARISGADPLQIQYLDQIRVDKLFGEAEELDTLSLWSPDRARFARENPGDPLAEIAIGRERIEGLNVPFDYPSIHRGMIYLAMGPALDNRIARPSFNRRGGLPPARAMYHEAFHSVQKWLDEMARRPDGAGVQVMNRALNNSQAIDEMTALIKKDPFSSYTEGMDRTEIQSEAFATWYLDRSIRLKSPGLQGAFERMKKFINTLRRKWKVAMGKDPTWVDVFEMAAEGKIADIGNQRIAKLTDQQLDRLKGRIDSDMDAALPGLTERVEGYLKQKQAEFDVLNRELAVDLTKGDC